MIALAMQRIGSAIRVRGRFREDNHDCFKNAGYVAKHIIIPEPQFPVVVIDEPLVANSIARIVRMLSSVDFNDEATFTANQIDGVWTDRLLPDELVATQRARPEAIPQRIFGVGRIAAQTSGALGFALIGLAHVATPPRPDCFAIRPLPARGERSATAQRLA
jgi:hypothetical protein